MTTLLPRIELESAPNPNAAVIWLHGLGADGNDFASLVPELVRQGCPAVRFVFPHAPSIPVTINGGYVMPAYHPSAGFHDTTMAARFWRALEAFAAQTRARTPPDVWQPDTRPVDYKRYTDSVPLIASSEVGVDTEWLSDGSVYCATLGENAGLCGIYSEASMDAGESVISRGPTGLTVVNLGTVQNADVNRVRVKAYWGLLNKSEKGIARAKEITS